MSTEHQIFWMMYAYQFCAMQWGAHLLGSVLWFWWLVPEYESYSACGIADSPPPIQKQNTTFCSCVQTAAVFIYAQDIPRRIPTIFILPHSGGRCLSLWARVCAPPAVRLLWEPLKCYTRPFFCICQTIILTRPQSLGLSLQTWFMMFFGFFLIIKICDGLLTYQSKDVVLNGAALALHMHH